MYEIIAVWGTLLQNERLWDQKRCKGKMQKGGKYVGCINPTAAGVLTEKPQ